MIQERKILRIKNAELNEDQDALAVEEPLEIGLVHGAGINLPVSVTMRTPGNDEELAVGFLFTEGIISERSQLLERISSSSGENEIKILLNPEFQPKINKLERNFYTSSSCGVCGKNSIDAIKQVCNLTLDKSDFKIKAETVFALPEKLRTAQETFRTTGGIHASATFDLQGNLETLREDVGRHNALDKLIGGEFLKQNSGEFTLENKILLLSGRASFELLQKAAMANVQVVCAIGAPSSLAVETAVDFGITLIGFLKNASCNVYSGEHRIEY